MLLDHKVKDASARTVSDQDEPKVSKLEKSYRQKFKSDAPDDLDWICDDAFTSYSEMALPGDTAQVHPFFFTKTMADLAMEEGVEILFGRVTAISFTSNRVHEIIYEDKDSGASHKLTATDLILAAGPWTSQILPTVPVEAQRAHSVVIQADVSPHAIFSEILLPTGFEDRGGTSIVTPEIYPRPDGTVYACGEADSDVPLPSSSDLVVCDENKCQDIINHVSSISTKLKDAEVLKKQACYLPHLSRGGPLIGETKSRGLYVATGHSCWGIQNSCATGKLMSEIIFDGKATSANIDSLHPSRYSI
ncbi:hypothetical protein K3495_g13246 [Podosphaera aphanis]|nr:hypothetical protein K3495_g13246 [Podosphaera aphanis]